MTLHSDMPCGASKLGKNNGIMHSSNVSAKTVVIDSHNIELAHLKKEVENEFWLLGNFLVQYFCDVLLCHWESCWSWKHTWRWSL